MQLEFKPSPSDFRGPIPTRLWAPAMPGNCAGPAARKSNSSATTQTRGHREGALPWLVPGCATSVGGQGSQVHHSCLLWSCWLSRTKVLSPSEAWSLHLVSVSPVLLLLLAGRVSALSLPTQFKKGKAEDPRGGYSSADLGHGVEFSRITSIVSGSDETAPAELPVLCCVCVVLFFFASSTWNVHH